MCFFCTDAHLIVSVHVCSGLWGPAAAAGNSGSSNSSNVVSKAIAPDDAPRHES